MSSLLSRELEMPLRGDCEHLYSSDMGTQERLQSVEDRFKNLEDTFKNANLGERIAKLEGKSEKSAPESWFKRNAYWIVPLVALILGGGFVWRPLDRLGHVESDLNYIKGQLQTVLELEKTRLNKLAALPPAEFQQSLPQVEDALGDALALKVPISQAVHKEFASRFSATDQNAPQYWPAVARYITYSSAQQSKFATTTLPPCVETEPIGLKMAEGTPIQDAPKNLMGRPGWKSGRPAIVFHNCTLSIENDPLLAKWAGRAISLRAIFVFQDCVVTYNGGNIDPMMDFSVFFNCSFQMTLTTEPPLRAKTLIASLLRDETSGIIQAG